MTKESFETLFGCKAKDYVKFRPTYPRALFEFIAACAPGRERVWDCGTGNGQAAVSLAEFFSDVVATDVSAAQLEQAISNSKVRYSVANAASAPLADRSCDAVTAANAVHWFEMPKFFAEARRVLKPGGVIAVWCYDFLPADHDLSRALAAMRQATNEFGPEPPQLVWQHYKTIEFPFEEIAAPVFETMISWTVEQFLGFASTWSTVEYCRKKTGRELIAELRHELAGVPADRQFEQVFHHPMRIGRA
jgi:ubiquinone/menaquinone biosynthesis C-methylase UbiE